MSRTAHKLVASSGSKGYEIEQSLMFEDGDSPYLIRTPSSAGNLKTWTVSFWTKRTELGAFQVMYSASNGSSGATDYGIIYFDSSDRFGFYYNNSTIALTNRVFRDVSSWYHIYVKYDATQGTASDRWDIKINGVSETSFSESNTPGQNTDIAWNNNIAHYIGRTHGGYYYPGYIAEFHNIDGTAKAVGDFAETDAATGQWIPKEYTGGSYGTNGFYLPFAKNARYCPYFNANASSGILTADHADFAVGSGNFTMECWFYVDEYAGNYRRVFGKSSSTGANAHTEYQVDIDSNNKPVSYVYDAADNGTSYLTLQSQTTVTDNKWHHVALVRNGTAFNLYLDGTSVANVTSSITVNDSTYQFGIGRVGEYASQIFKGWISNFRFVKGTAVYTSNFTPSTSPLTAITNTKLLCCQDSTATTENSGTSKTLTVTAAQISTDQMAPFTFDWYQDQSGQNNHYQADNLTVDDIMLDTPTNNFSTLNSAQAFNTTTGVLSQGNLFFAAGAYSSGHYSNISSTFNVPASGKWYVECRISIEAGAGNVTVFGVTDQDINWIGVANENLAGTDGFFTSLYSNYIKVIDSGTLGSGNTSATATSYILGMALDVDNGYAYFGVDSGSAMVWYQADGSTSGGDPTSGSTGTGGFARTFTTNDTITVSTSVSSSGGDGSQNHLNFGQNGTFCGTETAGGNADGAGIGNFFRSPPSGFKALCSKNLAAPAIKKSSEHFDIATYTGTGSTRSVTGLDHQPDILWIKARSTTDDHRVQDAVRGSTKQLDVNNTDAEYTAADGITSFNSDGFTIGADSSNQFNVSGTSSVAWSWKANGSGGANNSGDINATVSANTTAGISIVKWTANGSNADTIAHGLGVKPSVVWYKKIDNGGHGWYVLTDAIDGSQDYLAMNTTGAALSSAGAYGWATSSTISNWTWNNGHGMMAYAFAEVDGFSSFGSYTGNGEAENGPYVYTGFKPRLVIVKKSSVAGSSWFMWDSLRHPENVIDLAVWADANNGDTSHAEYEIDFLSNGFKLRGNNAGSNASGATHFYMAFAEAPFKYATAR